MVPYIHLFRTINNFYFYDVNRNEIINISEETFNILNSKEKSGEITGNENQEINRLIEEGYLVDTKVKKFIHPQTDEVDYIIDRKLGQLILQITQKCNLNCSYCIFASNNYKFHRSHTGNTMTWDTAKLAVDYYLLHSIDSNDYEISFYGGEPMLGFDLIKKIVNYVKIEYPHHKVSFSMTTNGTLVNGKRLEFLIANNFLLRFSIDGPQKIHDFNRRFLNDGSGSYKIISDNLKFIKENYLEYYKKIQLNMVIDPMNSYYEIENGIRSDEILNDLVNQASLIDDRGATKKLYIPERFKIEHSYSTFMSYLNMARIVKFSRDYNSLIDDFESARRVEECLLPSKTILECTSPSGPCIPGKSRWFVRYDGECFPCEKVSELSSFLSIGNIKDGLSSVKAKELLNIAKYSETKCSNCWAYRFCDHCAASYDNAGQVSVILNANNCNGTLASRDFTLRQIVLKKELEEYDVR